MSGSSLREGKEMTMTYNDNVFSIGRLVQLHKKKWEEDRNGNPCPSPAQYQAQVNPH